MRRWCWWTGGSSGSPPWRWPWSTPAVPAGPRTRTSRRSWCPGSGGRRKAAARSRPREPRSATSPTRVSWTLADLRDRPDEVRWARAADLAVVDSGDRVAVLDLSEVEAAVPLVMEGPAAAVWRALDRPRTTTEVCV